MWLKDSCLQMLHNWFKRNQCDLGKSAWLFICCGPLNLCFWFRYTSSSIFFLRLCSLLPLTVVYKQAVVCFWGSRSLICLPLPVGHWGHHGPGSIKLRKWEAPLSSPAGDWEHPLPAPALMINATPVQPQTFLPQIMPGSKRGWHF